MQQQLHPIVMVHHTTLLLLRIHHILLHHLLRPRISAVDVMVLEIAKDAEVPEEYMIMVL